MSEEDCAMIVDPDTTCSVCYAEFLEPDDLRMHIVQVHATDGSGRHCQFCSSNFSNSEDYVVHLRDEHIASLVCCTHCSRAFIDREKLKTHERKHQTWVKKSVFSCSNCRQMFNNTFDLKVHEYEMHPNSLDGIILQPYYSLLSSVLNINACTFLDSLGKSTAYICIQCDFSSNYVTEYVMHLTEKNCRSMACDMCSNVYKDRRRIVQHMIKTKCYINSAPTAEKKKECLKCLKQISMSIFTKHTKKCKPMKCTLCSHVFGTMYELSDHQTKIHPLVITLKTCQFCQREFVGTVSLEKHIKRVHKSQFHLYKYKCVYCETTYFKHPKDLFSHFLRKHSDLQPYSCKICNKSFRIRKRFTIHIKLDHNSNGFVEFDENYNVFFTDKKSENPFQPKCLLTDQLHEADQTDADLTDRQTENEQTDIQTDAEPNKQKPVRKPLKIRFKEAEKSASNVEMVNLNSDFMTGTETEASQTDNERKGKVLKRKKSNKPALEVTEHVPDSWSSDDDDQPLLKVKKREKIKRKVRSEMIAQQKKKFIRNPKKKFTCNICNKYCYTFQNYHHHVSLHFSNEDKKCIKCSQVFKSKTELNSHVEKEHTTSRLTETLKSLLERRKHSSDKAAPHISQAERFKKTIKKADLKGIIGKATISEVNEDLSVQKFIESFTPEESLKKTCVVETSVTVKTLSKMVHRAPKIKMKKFQAKPIPTNAKVSMPVRFKQAYKDDVKLSVKMIQTCDDTEVSFEDASVIDDEDRNEIPDVAQEVMLEDTVETKPKWNHKIIIPNLVLPKLPQKEISKLRIAHLLPEAPFYKIVKMDDMLRPEKPKKVSDPRPDTKREVKLPDGTKLVSVNPLAHLLGDKPVEEIVPLTKCKYYKPKTENYEEAITKALMRLDNPPKKYTKKKKSLEVEQ